MTSLKEMKNGKQYNEGIIVEILGFELFNNVNSNKITNEENVAKSNESENYQKYSKIIDNINIKIELSIQNEWKYKEIPKKEDNSFYKYALKLYKSDENQYAMLYFYNNQFGVCGTGRKSENIILNNEKEATIGYYNENKAWSDISFYNMNKNIAVINYGLMNADADEVIEIIKTININEDNL